MIVSLLKAADVARILNISRSQAYQLMQRGDIPTVRMGRSVRVREEDLERFILDNTVNSKSTAQRDSPLTR